MRALRMCGVWCAYVDGNNGVCTCCARALCAHSSSKYVERVERGVRVLLAAAECARTEYAGAHAWCACMDAWCARAEFIRSCLLREWGGSAWME